MVRAPSIDKNGRKKGAWSEEEDNKLRAYVTRYGHWNWRQLPKFAGLSRCGKSCRLRWVNYLRPNIKLGSYTKEEDDLIIKLHDELGNKWSAIAAKLPGRSDNEIKNHWHSHLRKCAKENIIIPEKQSSNESESESEAEADQKEQSSPFTALNEPQQYTETSHMIKVNQERKWTPKDNYSTGPSSSTKSSSSLSSNCAAFDTCNSNTGSSSSLSSVFDWVVEDSVVSPESFDETIDSFWREPFWRDTTDEYMEPPLVNHFLSPPSPEEFLWSYDHDGLYFEYVNLQLDETAS